MAENSKIAWTDHTFNPWLGCSRVSPGCKNCYAENLMDHRHHRVKWGPGQKRVRTKTWNDPFKWNRTAVDSGVRKRVFCASLADWLDEEVHEQWRSDLFDVIDHCTSIDWLMLTKRPQNAAAMLPQRWLDSPLPNVWFGVTAEDQKYYDLRVAQMSLIPASVHWVSYEPALGPLDNLWTDSDTTWAPNWLIIGGESDQMSPARPFAIEWAEKLIVNCRYACVTPFVKQIGSNALCLGLEYPTKDRAGADPAEWPESIRVREFPQVPAQIFAV